MSSLVCVIANGFFEHSVEDTVTYYDVGTLKGAPASVHGFAALDVALVPHGWLNSVIDIKSERGAPIPSHHFLTMMQFWFDVPKKSLTKRQNAKIDYQILRTRDGAQAFANRFVSLCRERDNELDGPCDADVGLYWESLESSLGSAAQEVLPALVAKPKRPWISGATLEIIEARHLARLNGNAAEETRLNHMVKLQARLDREMWLKDLAGSGDWGKLKLLRKGAGRKQGRLNDKTGMPISSEQRAQTFAEYLEEIQWKIRPAQLHGRL